MEDSFITLTYTNPIYGSLPDAVSYQFPVFFSLTRNTGDSTYVCLRPELPKEVRRGLYFQRTKSYGTWCTTGSSTARPWRHFWPD
jgi:hypothetical protein